jgi:5-hydroxyisourate hydrolase
MSSPARGPITTHVLDLATGRPAQGVGVELEIRSGTTWLRLGAGVTDADGRVQTLLEPGVVPEPNHYRLRFDVGGYFGARGVASFYPFVEVIFTLSDPTSHHHVPLLLSPFGYSTYRGS